MFKQETVQGWGKVEDSSGTVARPMDLDALKACLKTCVTDGKTVTLRAGGNSYGDLITNAGGIIIDMSAFDRIIDTDDQAGTMTVQPGVPLGRVADHALHQGWAPMAVPGSPFVTVGGAIANNVHGKDCFVHGNFGDGVLAMRVLFADGTIIETSRDTRRDIFDAVIGGLGLCGIIIEATIRLRRVESPFLGVELVRFRDTDEMVRLFEDAVGDWDMLVAWMDAFDANGRGVLEKGRWRDAPAKARDVPAMPARDTAARLRRAIGGFCRPFAGRWSFRLLNALFFRTVSFVARPKIKHFADFNFIVTTRIPEPPDLYPGGMIEVQVLIPTSGAAEMIRRLLALSREYAQESWWCGIKMHRRMPDTAASPLAFTGDGYSLSVNLPGQNMHHDGFGAFLDVLVALITDAGGCVYIGKDMVLKPEHIEGLFPQLAAFRTAKRKFDPDAIFESDLARRLFLK